MHRSSLNPEYDRPYGKSEYELATGPDHRKSIDKVKPRHHSLQAEGATKKWRLDSQLNTKWWEDPHGFNVRHPQAHQVQQAEQAENMDLSRGPDGQPRQQFQHAATTAPAFSNVTSSSGGSGDHVPQRPHQTNDPHVRYILNMRHPW